ncbi:MAG: hypothetical protein DYG89_10370 [Caldilinea sp. CFX5]|nr:hypothetical protein [Caldilinea sp. CFX5]
MSTGIAVIDMPTEMPTKERVVQRSSPSTGAKRTRSLQEWLDTRHANQFAELKKSYQITGDEHIFAFLRQHSQLIPILQEGRGAVSLLFGEDTLIPLVLMRDPEIGHESLVAWVQTDLPAREAVERLAELDDLWFADKLDVVGELLNFNIA